MTKKNKFIAIIISIFISVLLIEILLRINGIGSNNVLYYPSNFYGYYQVPDQKLNRRGNSISLDKYGNRNPEKNTLENSSLFFLGDSVTYGGSVVSDNETFSYLVAKKMNLNYLNISSNGWGIPNIINFIEFNNLYKKDSTYVLTCINDCYHRNIRKIEQNFFASKTDFMAISILYRYAIFKILNKSYSSDKQIISEKADNLKTAELSVNLLNDFKKKLESMNSKLILIHSPNKQRMKDLIIKEKIYEEYSRETILKILSKSKLEIIQITDYFNEKEIENFAHFFVDSVHLNKKGHEIYANIMYKLLNES